MHHVTFIAGVWSFLFVPSKNCKHKKITNIWRLLCSTAIIKRPVARLVCAFLFVSLPKFQKKTPEYRISIQYEQTSIITTQSDITTVGSLPLCCTDPNSQCCRQAALQPGAASATDHAALARRIKTHSVTATCCAAALGNSIAQVCVGQQ